MHIIIVIINVECNNILMHESREWTKTLSSRPSTQNKSFHVFIFLEFGVFGRRGLEEVRDRTAKKVASNVNTRQFHSFIQSTPNTSTNKESSHEIFFCCTCDYLQKAEKPLDQDKPPHKCWHTLNTHGQTHCFLFSTNNKVLVKKTPIK